MLSLPPNQPPSLCSRKPMAAFPPHPHLLWIPWLPLLTSPASCCCFPDPKPSRHLLQGCSSQGNKSAKGRPTPLPLLLKFSPPRFFSGSTAEHLLRSPCCGLPLLSEAIPPRSQRSLPTFPPPAHPSTPVSSTSGLSQ